jgi:hypothetical protein
MEKTLNDYKQEIAPKTETQKVEEFQNRNYRSFEACIMGFIGIFIISFITLNSENIFGIRINSIDDFLMFRITFWWFSLVERIFWVIVITYFANRLNRIPIIWQIFTFISPYLTLIIIGLTKKKDNYFYEFQSSKNKEFFFKTLDLSSKLKLYDHILNKNRFALNYHWFKTISMFNIDLFEDEQKALMTLQEYEKLFKNNMLTVLKSNMPHFKDDKEEVFYPLVKIGLIDKNYYSTENTNTSN